MAPHDKDTSPTLDYRQAEKMINLSIAKMENETHIEYKATMNRNDKKSWRLALSRLLHKLGIT